MGTTLVKVLTTYRAQPFVVDHFEGKTATKTRASSGDVCRVGTQCGIAATDELETSTFQDRYNLLVNKDANAIDGGVYADGITPVYMQQNLYRVPVRNVDSASAAPIGTPVMYYDTAQSTSHVLVGATTAADAVLGVLREEIAASGVGNYLVETVNQVPVGSTALTPIALT